MIENFDYTEILSSLSLSREYVSDIIERTKNNEILAGYYRRLYEETGKDKFFAKSYAVCCCGKSMLFDFHRKMKIADLIRIQLCHDRFCPNCQKMMQVTRLDKFMSPILSLTEDYDVSHLVFTAPNVAGPYLRSYISVFFEAFARLIQFINGKEKIHGVDFSPLGYVAALRNTEITYGNTGYHLHLHVIIAFKKDLYLPKLHRNKFSYDYIIDPETKKKRRVYKRSFSDLEIFLQKLWRLLVDQITARVYKFGVKFSEPLAKSSPLYNVFSKDVLTRSGNKRKRSRISLPIIQSMGINDGYSVIMDPVTNDHFVQAFKYAFKVESEDHNFMTYDHFSTLRHALKGRKLIQGYGAWRNLKVKDNIDQSFDDFFDVFKAYLWQVDRPESVNMLPEDVLALMKEGEYTFINRSKLRRFLEAPAMFDLMQHKDEFPPAPTPAFAFPNLGLAYDRYMAEKQRSDLFASIRRIEDPESGLSVVLLSEQQLDFFQTIF